MPHTQAQTRIIKKYVDIVVINIFNFFTRFYFCNEGEGEKNASWKLLGKVYVRCNNLYTNDKTIQKKIQLLVKILLYEWFFFISPTYIQENPSCKDARINCFCFVLISYNSFGLEISVIIFKYSILYLRYLHESNQYHSTINRNIQFTI